MSACQVLDRVLDIARINSGLLSGAHVLHVALPPRPKSSITLALKSRLGPEDPPIAPVMRNLGIDHQAGHGLWQQLEAIELPAHKGYVVTIDGSVLGPQGNCTTLKDLPDGRGSALVMRSSSSADFEVELRRVSSTWDEKQIELADPVLFIADYKPCLGKSCEFSISVSFTSASIGLKDPDPGYSSEPKIRYLAVAMEEDPDLHANTSCGLRAAIDQHRTITKTSVQVQRNQHRLQGTLEFNSSEWANQTIKVNVLASLVLPDEKEVGVSGYCAARIVPKQLPASAGSRNDASIPYAAALLALIVMLWLLSRGRAKEARQAPLSEHIEMAYDLHEDGASRLLDHSGYVPCRREELGKRRAWHILWEL
ncbi:Checkpoint protein hus1 [Durusdinium trenchii]|uniref:Checkpoint protein hus1 n=1 Tax=Durusdinium trenchii TaxID=1381693 RepID=A0ABP0QCR6_9DINO